MQPNKKIPSLADRLKAAYPQTDELYRFVIAREAQENALVRQVIHGETTFSEAWDAIDRQYLRPREIFPDAPDVTALPPSFTELERCVGTLDVAAGMTIVTLVTSGVIGITSIFAAHEGIVDLTAYNNAIGRRVSRRDLIFRGGLTGGAALLVLGAGGLYPLRAGYTKENMLASYNVRYLDNMFRNLY